MTFSEIAERWHRLIISFIKQEWQEMFLFFLKGGAMECDKTGEKFTIFAQRAKADGQLKGTT